MTRRQRGALLGVMIAAVALPWLVDWRTRAALRQEIGRLGGQLQGLRRVEAEHERLARLVTQGAGAARTPPTQAQELVNLRQVVGRLRQRTNELGQVAAENYRASKALVELAKGAVGTALSRESWNYVGYGKPEDALQSLLWANRSGDMPQVFNSGTTGFQALVTQELKASGDGSSEGLHELATDVKACRITDSSVISEDMLVLYVWFEYFEELQAQKGKAGYGAPIYVKKVRGEWKLDEP